ncbi:MAG: flagellar motor switch protein FliM [Anaerosolibacter sp.]|uniref:flagellar motor switch protein FliM n=1 Tax=Anaerosolibacter sp. TaxID=1872527 RepID=UPI002609D25F|nr:flagellar motor switch protein FliM [Anaerosolibacter sp.]MDF2545848.1 flagellar motor switch protein FliM [Anaerosolibacter sp.]
MSDVLSQSEIDALLQALSTGEVDVQEIQEDTKEKKIKKYDFRRPDKFAKDQLRTLQVIHENFSRLLNTYLSGYLRCLVNIDVFTVEQLTYHEFSNSISNPAVLGIVDFSPLSGQIIFDITPDIAFTLIDRILGGSGKPMDENRNFTEIEITLLKSVLKQMIRLLNEPWENVLDLEPRLEKVETNSQFAQLISPNETIALITLNIKIGEVEGMLNICIPHLVIEPILSQLSTKYWFNSTTKESTPDDQKMIENRINKASIPVRAVIGKTNITVNEFLDLQVGDVVQLDTTIDEDMKIYVGNELKYRGKPGTKKKKLAVQIVSVVGKEEI